MLRQRFWANYMKQYDADDTGTFSHVEITTMLDSLGSTLSRETLNTWFSRLGKNPTNGELSRHEVIQFLEEETQRPLSQKKKISGSMDDPLSAAPSGLATPSVSSALSSEPLHLDQLDFTGPEFHRSSEPDAPNATPSQVAGNSGVVGSLPVPAGPHLGNKSGVLPTVDDLPKHAKQGGSSGHQQSTSSEEEDSSGSNSDDNVERIINIKTCPLCHRPRLNAKGEMDIITHIAVCASQDWEKVDRITVGNFVTASQAQRKWYTKAIAKLSTGAYSIGAVSLPFY
jgi:phosphatidylserine decarboxylase